MESCVGYQIFCCSKVPIRIPQRDMRKPATKIWRFCMVMPKQRPCEGICVFSLGSFIHRSLATFHTWDPHGILKPGFTHAHLSHSNAEVPPKEMICFWRVQYFLILIDQAISQPCPKNMDHHTCSIFITHLLIWFQCPFKILYLRLYSSDHFIRSQLADSVQRVGVELFLMMVCQTKDIVKVKFPCVHKMRCRFLPWTHTFSTKKGNFILRQKSPCSSQQMVHEYCPAVILFTHE